MKALLMILALTVGSQAHALDLAAEIHKRDRSTETLIHSLRNRAKGPIPKIKNRRGDEFRIALIRVPKH